MGIGGVKPADAKYYDDFVDIHLTHIYCAHPDSAVSFEEKVKNYMEEIKKSGKALIVSECCWGSFDDEMRALLIKITLDVFTKYGVGYVAHALQYSGCTDLHDYGDGRTTPDIGNLCFVKKDGTLRAGHDIFNEY